MSAVVNLGNYRGRCGRLFGETCLEAGELLLGEALPEILADIDFDRFGIGVLGRREWGDLNLVAGCLLCPPASFRYRDVVFLAEFAEPAAGELEALAELRRGHGPDEIVEFLAGQPLVPAIHRIRGLLIAGYR
jgi:hypothetical protein